MKENNEPTKEDMDKWKLDLINGEPSKRTICGVLRKLLGLVETAEERELILMAFTMAKKMDAKLWQYNTEASTAKYHGGKIECHS